MRCGRCGNENKDGNRFCGMCGAPLAAKTPVGVQTTGAGAPVARAAVSSSPTPAGTPAPVVTPAPLAAGASPRQQTPVPNTNAERRPEPLPATHRAPSYFHQTTGSSIAGPSFLGLNTPSTGDESERAEFESHGDRHSGSLPERDDLRPSSRSLDYLLEDEEEPRRRWGKFVLGAVALALAVGLGYLHFKQGGFEWLKAGDQKTAATATSPDATPGGANSAGQSGATITPDNASAQPGVGAGNPASTAATPAQDAPLASGQSSATPNAAQNAVPNSSPADSGASAASAPVQSAAQTPANSDEKQASTDSDEESSDTDTTAPAPKARAPRVAKAAAAKPSPTRPVDRVSEAERYIYGRGVPQDCDRGVRLLKAEQSDAKAMISLGGLYTTGTCTPRDLPTAYRWYAMALHKQPDNQTLQDDLQRLWSKMTQPERQLAIKLSQ